MGNRPLNRRSRLLKTVGLLGFCTGVAVAQQVPISAAPAANEHVTISPVYWGDTVVGSSKLVRTKNGVSFTYHTWSLEAAAGQVVTVWIVVFNHPEFCATSPCTDADLFNPLVGGDFLLGAGHVIGKSGVGNFGGHLRVGEISQSGLAEAGLGPAVGLLPDLTFSAEIHMALHSHGPAVSGPTLKAQLSSFLGGCSGGVDDFVVEPDFPDAVGECITFQSTIHQ